MAPRLSITHLLRLRDLSRVGARNPQQSGVGRYLYQVRAFGDAEIWIVTSRAAARCALDD